MIASTLRQIKAVAGSRAAVLSSVWKHPLNRGSKIHAVRDYIIWNAARFSMDARHLVAMPGGIEIIVGRKENYGTTVYVHGVPDFQEMLFLAHLLRPEDLFVDVGANVGMYSIWVARMSGASALAMEPVPVTFATLARNVRLNDLGTAIDIQQVAVGEAAGEVMMTANAGGFGHILSNPAAHDVVRTRIDTLDTILAGRTPAAMKIDVEGFEHHVLKGAATTFGSPVLQAIVVELQDKLLQRYKTSEQDVRRLLSDYGFETCQYDPLSRHLDNSTSQRGLNGIFIRTETVPLIRARLAEGNKVPVRGFPQGI